MATLPECHLQPPWLLSPAGSQTGLWTTGWAWFFIQTTKTKHLFVLPFFFLPSPQKRNYYNYLWIQSALVCLQKMCNFNKSAKNISISVSLWFGHVKNMRACIVVELPMLCTGFCLSSVLVHSVCDAWWWEQKDGMALWSVGVGFLCGNSWSTTHILYSLVFVSLSCPFM